jgi:hypothetical protein
MDGDRVGVIVEELGSLGGRKLICCFGIIGII